MSMHLFIEWNNLAEIIKWVLCALNGGETHLFPELALEYASIGFVTSFFSHSKKMGSAVILTHWDTDKQRQISW